MKTTYFEAGKGRFKVVGELAEGTVVELPTGEKSVYRGYGQSGQAFGRDLDKPAVRADWAGKGQRALSHVVFEWEGVRYSLPTTSNRTPSFLQLPDRRVLECERWLGIEPPRPDGLRLSTALNGVQALACDFVTFTAPNGQTYEADRARMPEGRLLVRNDEYGVWTLESDADGTYHTVETEDGDDLWSIPWATRPRRR